MPPRALGVVVTVTEGERNVAAIDQPQRLAVEKRSTEIKVAWSILSTNP
jgi:hypothetical protein